MEQTQQLRQKHQIELSDLHSEARRQIEIMQEMHELRIQMINENICKIIQDTQKENDSRVAAVQAETNEQIERHTIVKSLQEV